jgi:serine/threonine-protein kinase
MGSVFRGWDPRLQRTVALKTIRVLSGDATGDQGEKLLAEAVAVAKIAHPHVVGVFDAEESGGAAFVAMEFVDGIGLDRYLEKRGRLDWREVVPLGAAIASGLAAAHAQGVLHRDIKPGNVLLGHDGSIKIADFGLATYLNRLHDAPGKVFGTPGFLSPEALQGMPIDERSDLYAMGIVLHRSVTGRYPFRGGSFRDLVVQTVRDPAPSASELEQSMPLELAELISALLVKDPNGRLAPAAELARRFDDLAREHSLLWRLDYVAGSAQPGSTVSSVAASMPTVRLDADLA